MKDIVRDKCQKIWINKSFTVQIITPCVIKEVGAHFNCPALQVAELENQGSLGQCLTHFEKSVHKQSSVSLHHICFNGRPWLVQSGLQDGRRARFSRLGLRAGCLFAQNSCKDIKVLVSAASLLMFCVFIFLYYFTML